MYSDEARSGIDLARRPGLRRLPEDVTTRKADFRAVLVYDISRWGRFQDVPVTREEVSGAIGVGDELLAMPSGRQAGSRACLPMRATCLRWREHSGGLLREVHAELKALQSHPSAKQRSEETRLSYSQL